MAKKKTATKKTSNTPLKILVAFDKVGNVRDDTTDGLLEGLCMGNYYTAPDIKNLILETESNDEESPQDVYEVTFKRIGTITSKVRVFNEYV
jgi:hypothetical protein